MNKDSKKKTFDWLKPPNWQIKCDKKKNKGMERAACTLFKQRITAVSDEWSSIPAAAVLELTWSISIQMYYDHVVFFTVLVPVDRFGELWTLFMGESTSDTATLLRGNPPLSEKSHSSRWSLMQKQQQHTCTCIKQDTEMQNYVQPQALCNVWKQRTCFYWVWVSSGSVLKAQDFNWCRDTSASFYLF